MFMATYMVTRSCYVWQLKWLPEAAMYGNLHGTRSCYVWQLTWLPEAAM